MLRRARVSPGLPAEHRSYIVARPCEGEVGLILPFERKLAIDSIARPGHVEFWLMVS